MKNYIFKVKNIKHLKKELRIIKKKCTRCNNLKKLLIIIDAIKILVAEITNAKNVGEKNTNTHVKYVGKNI